MIKQFKKSSYKISRMAAIGCLIATSVTFTNGVTVKALERNNTGIATARNIVNINDKHKFLIDAPLKAYNNIEKVEKVIGFKFKVPDFIPEPNKAEVDSLQVIKLSDNDNVLLIYLANNVNFSFQASEKDPLEYLKKIETEKYGKSDKLKIESEEQTMKLGETNGFCITVTTTSPAETMENGYIRKESQDVDKYFAWKNEGLWYSINYNSILNIKGEESKQMLDISKNNIEKIAKSIKYPEVIRNVDYSVKEEVSTEVCVMSIYDKEDLEKAKNILGFNPKLPLKINEDINISGAVVQVSVDSDIKNNKINYEIDNFYTNKNGSITFNQARTSRDYEDIKKNGYFIDKATEDNKPKQIKAEKLDINNNEVFKYSENEYIPTLTYRWKENGIYCSVIFFDEAENSDEIIKTFVNSKPIY